jgi:hypothetical protein
MARLNPPKKPKSKAAEGDSGHSISKRGIPRKVISLEDLEVAQCLLLSNSHANITTSILNPQKKDVVDAARELDRNGGDIVNGARWPNRKPKTLQDAQGMILYSAVQNASEMYWLCCRGVWRRCG